MELYPGEVKLVNITNFNGVDSISLLPDIRDNLKANFWYDADDEKIIDILGELK